MRFQRISDKGSIVLIGSFNPQIFQPFWFSNNKLLQNNEVEIAEIEVISRDITSFGIPWLKVQVFLEKFLAITGEESQFLPLRDFVIGTFHLLGHTPIRQMGINRDIQFEMASESDWHKVGNKLAPKKDLWDKLLPSPGMKTLIIDSKRDDAYNGLINITVRPVLEKKGSSPKSAVNFFPRRDP